MAVGTSEYDQDDDDEDVATIMMDVLCCGFLCLFFLDTPGLTFVEMCATTPL